MNHLGSLHDEHSVHVIIFLYSLFCVVSRWERSEFLIGGIQQEFRIVLEFTSSETLPAHILMDNIKLVDCFPGMKTFF